MDAVLVQPAECHDTCVDVRLHNHMANVNPVAESTMWRVDCDDCATCIRVLPTKDEAIEAAKQHVQMTVEEYWTERNA